MIAVVMLFFSIAIVQARSHVDSTEALTNRSTTTRETKQCLTEEDLHLDDCFLDDLEIPALLAICERMGLSEEEHIRPYLMDGDWNRGSLSNHEVYVTAALECLQVEQSIHSMLDNASIDPALTDNGQDTDALADVILNLAQSNPNALADMQDNLKKQDEELWNKLMTELEGRGPTGLADLVREMS